MQTTFSLPAAALAALTQFQQSPLFAKQRKAVRRAERCQAFDAALPRDRRERRFWKPYVI